MRIKKKNIVRLASFSALGAGALGVAAGTAQAATVIPITGGPFVIGANNLTRWSTSLPGGNILGVSRHSFLGNLTYLPQQSVGIFGNNPSFQFHKVPGGLLKIVSSGVTWSSPKALGTNIGPNAIIAGRTSAVRAFGGGYPAGTFTNEYALFTFLNGATTEYGWLELSSSVFPSTQFSGFNSGAPTVTVLAGAFDSSPLAAGSPNGLPGGCTGGDDENEGDDLGGCSVPEPSSLAMFGLAAMALGASGLRRWRAARKPAA